MAEILLAKVINKEIKVDLIINWLIEKKLQEQYFTENNRCKCSRADFLTYFLNFIHEEIPCSNKCSESPQKPIARRLEPAQNGETSFSKKFNSLLNEDKSGLIKSSSYPLALNKSQENTPKMCRDSSTPRIMKVPSEYIFNNAHISPISPLYRTQASFSTPKNEWHSFTNGSSEKGTSLCLGDFIVNRRSSAKKKASRNILTSDFSDESSRRIKPTSLSQVKSNSSFRQSDNSFNNFENTKEITADNLNNSRNFLAEERLKIMSRKDDNVSAASSKHFNANLVNFTSKVEPDVDLVSNKEELSYLVEIYANILKNNLVLNVTSEIYFLISLLLTKHINDDTSMNSNEDICNSVDFLNEEDRSDLSGVLKCVKRHLRSSDLFQTIHNVVYFAAKCLETQLDILKDYDKSTLYFLCQSNRLRIFSSAFAEKLFKISERKPERILEVVDPNVLTNVCFNIEMDNRENFTTDSAFHAFRKQRDLFYEILRIWENQRLVTGWNFAFSLGGKIKSLFSLQNDPAAIVHFSRLFKAQLLSTCGRIQKDEGFPDIPFLSSIPNIDADKLNRLNSRLVTKQSSNGINSLPLFTGNQEFYRDFIIIACNHSFNKHLCDALISEIMELNDSKFSCTDLEAIDGSVDSETRKSYIACLKSLRLLAKFLGFVEALPYKSDCSSFSEKVLNFQISWRKEVSPVFDVKKLLQNAVEQKNLILIVPWLTKYLSMLDFVTLRLPYYISLHKILFDIHKNCDKMLGQNSNANGYKVSLVKFSLGWLFELQHFPDSEYFNFCTRDIENEIYPPENKKTNNSVVTERKLDDLNIIDQNILYICCPYLEEIKKLLSNNAVRSSVTVKHITPVTAVQSSDEVAKKKLEHQLEEAFFNGQPLSLRKTVEFVSERIASACVKHICNSVVPPFKKSSLDKLKDFLSSWSKEQKLSSPSREKSIKAALRSKVNQTAQSELQSLVDACETEVCNIVKERVPPTVTNQLSIDVLSQTRDVCIAITTRMCLERIRQWMSSHVTIAVFSKDFNNELQKALSPETKKAKEKLAFALPSSGKRKNHNDGATSAFHLLEKLKVLTVNILEESTSVDYKIVDNVLDEAFITLTERTDVNECITVNICMILVDVCLLMVTHKQGIITENLLKKFLRVWNCVDKNGDLFKNLLCPRNVMLFAQSGMGLEVWETFAYFVAFLVNEGVLTPEEFESQCIGFYKKEWDQETLDNFSAFLRKFLQCYKTNKEDLNKFTLLLEFLTDFCKDL